MAISCEVGCRKPDRGIFLHAARQFHLPPASVLHIGDSPGFDLEGATRAGLQALGLRRARAGGDPAWMPSLGQLLERL